MCVFVLRPRIEVSEHEIEVAKEFGWIPKDLDHKKAEERVRNMKRAAQQLKTVVPTDYYDVDPRFEYTLKGLGLTKE